MKRTEGPKGAWHPLKAILMLALTASMGLLVVAPPAAAVSCLVPIGTISGTVHNPTSTPTGLYELRLDLNSSKYAPNFAANDSNLRVLIGGSAATAWMEANALATAKDTIIWVGNQSLAGSASVAIVIQVFATSCFMLGAGSGVLGVYPGYTGSYGRFDNGNLTFARYWNFSGLVQSNEFTASGSMAVTQDDGISLHSTGGGQTYRLVTTFSGHKAAETNASISGSGTGSALDVLYLQTVNTFAGQSNGGLTCRFGGNDCTTNGTLVPLHRYVIGVVSNASLSKGQMDYTDVGQNGWLWNASSNTAYYMDTNTYMNSTWLRIRDVPSNTMPTVTLGAFVPNGSGGGGLFTGSPVTVIVALLIVAGAVGGTLGLIVTVRHRQRGSY